MIITLSHIHEHLLKMTEMLHKLGNDNIHIKKQHKKIMATLAEVQQSLTDLQTSVDTKQAEVIAEIKDLKDQIAAGGTVTAADLDALVATVKGIQTDVDTTDQG